MDSEPSSNDKGNPKKYLRNIDDTYILDETSGIYKPKSENSKDQGQERTTGEREESPFHVNVRRDWMPIRISIISAFISGFTLIGLGFTVYFARLQWREMVKATTATECAANAASVSADQAAKQVVELKKQIASQGGFVVVNAPTTLKREEINQVEAQVCNVGGTYVTELKSRGEQHLPSYEGESLENEFFATIKRMKTLPLSEEFHDFQWGNSIGPGSCLKYILTPGESVYTVRTAYFFWIQLTYRDVFGNQKITAPFCRYYQFKGTQLRPCEEYEAMFMEFRKQRKAQNQNPKP